MVTGVSSINPELHVALSTIVCEIRSVHIVIPGFSQSELDYINLVKGRGQLLAWKF